MGNFGWGWRWGTLGGGGDGGLWVCLRRGNPGWPTAQRPSAKVPNGWLFFNVDSFGHIGS